MRGSIITGDDMFLYGVSFERTVESVRGELAKKLDAITKHRAETFEKLKTGLQEEKRTPVDAETVLASVRRRQQHYVIERAMSERVQKLVQLATVVTRADDMIERLGFFVEQLKQEQERRLLTLSMSDVTFIYRPFSAEEFDQTCCGGLFAGLGSPAMTSMSSVVARPGRHSVGSGYAQDADSIADVLSDAGNDLDLGTS